MSDFPIGWAETSLGEIASQGQYGWTTKASHQGYIKYLRTTDLTSGHINWNTVPYCQDIPPATEKYKVQLGDILISRAGSVGFSILIEDLPSTPVVFASYLIRYNPNPEVNSKFIARFLQSRAYWQQISDFSAGIALPNVNAKKLANVVLPIAPLNEQKRIAEKLDSLLTRVDSCQSHLERVPQILKRFRQSVLAAAFHGELTERDPNDEPASALLARLQGDGRVKSKKSIDLVLLDNYDLTELPVGWGYTFIDPLLSLTRRGMKTGPFGSALKKSDHRQDGVPVLGIENIGRARFMPGSKIHISKEKAKQLSEYDAVPGDILISRSGTVGEVCVVPSDIGDARISTNLIRLSLARDAMLPQFFCLLFNGSPFVLKQVNDLCKGSTRPFLNQTILSSIVFPLPPLAEQRRIITAVEKLFAYADRLEARYSSAIERVEQLTPSLLAKAFRGELVEQDPNDEPASVLLERIRLSREADNFVATNEESINSQIPNA